LGFVEIRKNILDYIAYAIIVFSIAIVYIYFNKKENRGGIWGSEINSTVKTELLLKQKNYNQDVMGYEYNPKNIYVVLPLNNMHCSTCISEVADYLEILSFYIKGISIKPIFTFNNLSDKQIEKRIKLINLKVPFYRVELGKEHDFLGLIETNAMFIYGEKALFKRFMPSQITPYKVKLSSIKRALYIIKQKMEEK